MKPEITCCVCGMNMVDGAMEHIGVGHSNSKIKSRGWSCGFCENEFLSTDEEKGPVKRNFSKKNH